MTKHQGWGRDAQTLLLLCVCATGALGGSSNGEAVSVGGSLLGGLWSLTTAQLRDANRLLSDAATHQQQILWMLAGLGLALVTVGLTVVMVRWAARAMDWTVRMALRAGLVFLIMAVAMALLAVAAPGLAQMLDLSARDALRSTRLSANPPDGKAGPGLVTLRVPGTDETLTLPRLTTAVENDSSWLRRPMASLARTALGPEFFQAMFGSDSDTAAGGGAGGGGGWTWAVLRYGVNAMLSTTGLLTKTLLSGVGEVLQTLYRNIATPADPATSDTSPQSSAFGVPPPPSS